jgi:hypothetical protein
MKGSYFCVAEDGHRFEVAIPEFVLSIPRALPYGSHYIDVVCEMLSCSVVLTVSLFFNARFVFRASSGKHGPPYDKDQYKERHSGF